MSIQLEDGSEISAYPEHYVASNRVAGNWLIFIDRDGNRVPYPDLAIEPVEFWQSSQTFTEYPVRWKVQVPSADIELDVRAAFARSGIHHADLEALVLGRASRSRRHDRRPPGARRRHRRAQRLHVLRGPRRILRGGGQGRAQIGRAHPAASSPTRRPRSSWSAGSRVRSTWTGSISPSTAGR